MKQKLVQCGLSPLNLIGQKALEDSPLLNPCPTLRKRVSTPTGHGSPTVSVHTSGMYSGEN